MRRQQQPNLGYGGGVSMTVALDPNNRRSPVNFADSVHFGYGVNGGGVNQANTIGYSNTIGNGQANGNSFGGKTSTCIVSLRTAVRLSTHHFLHPLNYSSLFATCPRDDKISLVGSGAGDGYGYGGGHANTLVAGSLGYDQAQTNNYGFSGSTGNAFGQGMSVKNASLHCLGSHNIFGRQSNKVILSRGSHWTGYPFWPTMMKERLLF